MEDEINPLQLGFDIGAVISQTDYWKDTRKFRHRARLILMALDIDYNVSDDPLFIFGCGQGCSYRHKFPRDRNLEGEARNPES